VRIGIYGGSFDPPHIGHRVLALDAIESLKLDRLIVVPAGIQPLKANKTDGATAEQRVEMAKIAFAGEECVIVDETEVQRPGLSFTVDTLEAYSAENPDAEIFLLLGRDSFESLDRWKNPGRIRELCTIALLERGNEAGRGEGGAVIAATRRIDVSSSEIRERRKAGKPISAFVPDGVLSYIEKNNLYAPTSASQE
jgi:nicotinate-nucleotide adenylyltransferase